MKKIVKTSAAPDAIGPYSQGVVHNGILYCSGQIALIPVEMKIIDGGVNIQAEQVMENMKAVVEASGSSMEKVLKCTIFLADMNDFTSVNEVYGRYFKADPPAREAVAVKTLPKNVLVEISCIAAV